MPQLVETRMILIAGGDVTAVEEVALPLFHAGHIPVVGDWLVEPLVALSGPPPVEEETFAEIFQPLADRLLARCDAIIRVGGPSPRADAVVGLGRSRGMRVFFSLKEALDG
jgi:hypothetical protein